MNSTLSVAERERILRMARAANLERSAPKIAPVVPVERGGRLALSFAQQRLWFLEQLGELGGTYHIPLRSRLRGALDRGALARALERIVARHESLRTVFVPVDGEPEQRIVPVEESGFRLVEHDLRGEAHPALAMERLAAREPGAPFDLQRGPVFRACLIRLADDDHVLLVTMHHIVSDGWSMGVFTDELAALYTAFSQGQPDPLPPLAVQYADYAAWQRRWVEGELLERQASYWEQALAGAPELLQLPTDRARPRKQDFAGDSVKLELDESLTAGLTALSHRCGMTLFMTVLAGWATVLARLAGQDEVVIGTPSANRTRPEVEGLIGFFVNTLPVRVDLSASPTVAELLAQVKVSALDAQRNQDIPFEQVVERLRPVRSLAYTPLFQVMFAWQNAPDDDLELPGLTADRVDAVDADTAKFDLSLALWEDEGRIAGAVEYATSLFERATVERFAEYFRRVLEGMAADDAAPVDGIPMLPAAERRQVVEGWNDTDAGYPRTSCVHELFLAQAARTPNAIALSWRGERLTYAELEARANQLSRALQRRGVRPEVRVGICLPRTPELVAALLGVLGAGGAYVPLDPAYPRERLGFMLEDAGITLVITESRLADRLPGGAAGLLLLDAERDALASEPGTAPPSGVVPGNLSHVIFTSGSTGRPKGVMIRHSSVVVLLHWLRENVTDEERSSVLFSTSINFDVSVAEIFGTLCWGGKLVLAENALELPELEEEVVYASMVPSVAAELLRDRGIPAGVKTLNLGGEALPGALAQGLYALGTVEKVGNLYGPTEDTTYSTYSLVPRGTNEVRVGRPVANTRAYVLDRHLQPMPMGVAGELYLAGDGVSRGYAGRPGMTAERFLPCSFGPAGARMYRVMDRVRWRPDGELEYLGRTDFQVKIRGFRIEPGEIEARLAEHPDVREAVVIAREDAPGERRLVAYLVGDAGAEALRAHLSARVPAHMVPAAYVRLDALPLTPNGKVDRRALPAPEVDAFAARGYEAPSGRVERAVAAIWAELLGAERVGRGDHFFESGGHSLLAVRVTSRVRQALGVEASPGDLFERPVLSDFARGLETAARAEAMTITPVDRRAAIPLSFAQQRLWFLEQLGGTGVAYHIPMHLRLRGGLDRGALKRALDRIVARHEALRTTFPAADGEPVQRIAPVEESAFRLVEHDLHASPDAEDALRRLVCDEASAPFGLERGPLIRGRLVRMAADDHVLMITMHHVVSDGWSVGVLHRELGVLYGAFVRGEQDPLAPLPVQYADYAAWHRGWVEGPVLEAQAEYWTQTLSGAPELLELPADHPRPPRQDFAGALVDVALDEALTAALKTVSQRHGATLYMTLLAGWAVVLARLSGQDDVVIGTPSANRGRAEVEELIGLFVNTLLVRVNLAASPSVAELLAQVKARALEAQRNQDIPFEQVVERVRPTRSLAYGSLFQVMFAWQNETGGAPELPGLTVGDAGPAGTDTAKFDLLLALGEHDGRIVGGLTYATALFERATAQRFVGYLRRALEEMAADAARPVDRLTLLSPAERRQVVEEWNETDAAYPSELCIHELFQDQAGRTPDAVALVFEGREMGYAELNTRANRLAHHLRALGVGPDARVGICVERGVEMVVGLLAILKAGGAYVPLDPGYPEERLRYVLADSRPAGLVTQVALRERFADLELPVVVLDADAACWAELPEHDAPRGALTPDHLAYLIYTSGSTGRPKGVAIQHRNTVNLLAWAAGEFARKGLEHTLFATSLNFDLAVFECFVPLTVGATVHIVRDALELARGEVEPTLVNTVPSAMAALTEADGVPASVRTVNLAGEPLKRALVERIFATTSVRTVCNLYGPSETTTYSTWVAMGRETGFVPHIGRPIANTRAYVLGAGGDPLPVGVAGELYLGGAGVARGYLARPALTAERFVADPFGREPGARLYRTGDLCRWLPGGTLEYLGRNDHQVKLRGFRIELGEIEARLLEHEAVREAAVVAREDGGETRLVAYVAGAGIEVDALRAHLGRRLPAYMVPAAFVRLDALPLTPNGKLDRGALPPPEGEAYARSGYETPQGETEEMLAEIWAEVLGVERVGRWDNFFTLGGHSLLAVKLVLQVDRRMEVEIDLRDVFESPVLSGLAQHVLDAQLAQFDAADLARVAADSQWG